MTRSRGFTLVELLIVIAIAGILAALAVPIYNGYITRSRQAVANNNLQTLRLAEEAFFFDNNTYKTGTYDAVAGTDSLNIGWKPNEDGNKYFRYTVVAGDCGNISKCFKITVTGADGKVSYTE